MRVLLSCLTCFLFTYAAYSQPVAVLAASIKNSTTDTIEIKVEDNDVIWKWDTYHLIKKDGSFQGNLPVKKPSFFYLKEGPNYVNGLIEPGDSIGIQYDAYNMGATLLFAGNKKNSLKIYNQLVRFKLRDKLKLQLPIAKQNPNPFDYLLHYLDSLESFYLNGIRQHSKEMSTEALTALNGYIKAQFISSRYHAVTQVYSESVDKTLEVRVKELTKYSLQQIKTIRQFEEKYNEVSAYVNAVYGVLFRHYDGLQLEDKMDKSLTKKFAYLNSQLPAKLRTPVLTMFIEFEMGKTNDANEIKSVIDQYFTSDANEVYNNYINSKFQALTALKKGLPAPNFTLQDKNGQVVTLDSLRGKVIYIDFWFASCMPCHALFKKLKPVKDYFRDQTEIIFLNVSVDTEKLWKESLQKFQIHGYHVFTQNKEREHSIIKDYKVFQYPTSFIIDRNGKIFNANPPDDPKELISQIEQILGL